MDEKHLLQKKKKTEVIRGQNHDIPGFRSNAPRRPPPPPAAPTPPHWHAITPPLPTLLSTSNVQQGTYRLHVKTDDSCSLFCPTLSVVENKPRRAS